MKIVHFRVSNALRWNFSFIVIALAISLLAQSLSAATITWTSNFGGNWDNSASWDSALFPNSSTDDVVIDDGDSVVNVFLNINASVKNLTIGSSATSPNDMLTINNGRSLTVFGDVANNGAINLNGLGSLTNLYFAKSNAQLVGDGKIVLPGVSGVRIRGQAGTEILTQGASHTIEGAGKVGDNTLGFINEGLFHANLLNKSLVVDPSAADVDGNGTNFWNKATGTLRASSNGTLVLQNGVFKNDGVIEALDQSHVNLIGATIEGGVFTTAGTGDINLMSGSIKLINVTNNGLLNINNTVDPRLQGTIVNNATVNQNSAGSSTDVHLVGDVLLTTSGGNNTGLWTMSNNAQNRFRGTASTDILTNDVNHTIQGAGSIGLNTMGLINKHLIDANASISLTIDPSTADVDGNGNNMWNTSTGTLRASNGGKLILQNGVIRNDNVIEALANSTVDLANVTIVGGTLTTSGVNSSVNIISNTVQLENVTNAGLININNGVDPRLKGTFTNNATVMQNSAGSTTDVNLVGDVLLTGSGTWTMTPSIQNGFQGIVGGEILTNDVNHTIQGAGGLGKNDIGLINKGVIDNNTTSTLTIDPVDANLDGNGADLVNDSIIRVTGGGILRFQSGRFKNNNVISASNSSTIDLGAGTIIDTGLFTTDATSQVNISANTVKLINVTSTAKINILNTIDPQFEGTFTNNNVVTQNSAGSTTTATIVGDLLLTGTGVWTMSDNVENEFSGSGVLTNDTTHTIRGAGRIGDNSIGVINKGLIDNTGPAILILDPVDGDLDGNGADFVNDSTIQVTGGGTLRLQGGQFKNNNIIQASNSSTINLNANAIIEDGLLTTDATSQVIVAAGSAKFKNVTSTAKININNTIDPMFEGTFTNNGTVMQNSAGSITTATIVGDLLLTGTGVWTMTNNAQNEFGGSGVLTNDTSHTIKGAGNIGANVIGVINKGLIDNDGPAILILDPVDGDLDGNGADFVNDSTIQVTGGGTLRLKSGLFKNNNLIQATNSSTIDLSANTILEGGILATSGGSVVTIGSGLVLLRNMTSNATVNINNGIDPELGGTITNNGTVMQNSAGSTTTTTIVGNVLLTGTGLWTMSNNVQNQFAGTVDTDVLTNDVKHTIEGAGNLGANSMGLLNKGLIQNNVSNTLTIDPADATGFINRGDLVASSGSGGVILIGAGHQNAAGGQIVIESELTIQTNATLTNNVGGVIKGNGTLDINGTFVNHGTVAPGLSPGTLTVDGDYDNGDGTLAIELGGTTQGVTYDLLAVTGDALFSGNFLSVVFVAGFENSVSPSDEFTIVTANDITLSATFPAVGQRFSTADSLGSFVLALNGSNALVLTNFEPVPEPSSIILLLLGSLALLRFARRK